MAADVRAVVREVEGLGDKVAKEAHVLFKSSVNKCEDNRMRCISRWMIHPKLLKRTFQGLMVMPFCCEALLAPQYKIEHIYTPYKRHHMSQECKEDALFHRILCKMDPNTFPSPSQSRKAIEYGRLLVLRADDYCLPTSTSGGFSLDLQIRDVGIVANSSMTLYDGDVIAIRSRLDNGLYPQSYTKYVDPPMNIEEFMAVKNNPVMFEDDYIAIVNKPAGLDCIGEKRLDLQSILPFVLRPPSEKMIPKNNPTKQCYLPRPVHRIDRKTSGCVLVAKSKNAMRQFSHLFATRQVQKSYCAITFGEPTPFDKNNTVAIDGKDYDIIDYPIDGKDAVTLWREVLSVTTQAYGKLSLLHCLPKTGRNHQIRRHLSYCLKVPIAGDNKYDGGGELTKKTRKLGMFLCSNRIEFLHPMDKVCRVEMPLPDTFYALLGLDRNEVVI